MLVSVWTTALYDQRGKRDGDECRMHATFGHNRNECHRNVLLGGQLLSDHSLVARLQLAHRSRLQEARTVVVTGHMASSSV